jgi:hypothetical protein
MRLRLLPSQKRLGYHRSTAQEEAEFVLCSQFIIPRSNSLEPPNIRLRSSYIAKIGGPNGRVEADETFVGEKVKSISPIPTDTGNREA